MLKSKKIKTKYWFLYVSWRNVNPGGEVFTLLRFIPSIIMTISSQKFFDSEKIWIQSCNDFRDRTIARHFNRCLSDFEIRSTNSLILNINWNNFSHAEFLVHLEWKNEYSLQRSSYFPLTKNWCTSNKESVLDVSVCF